MLVMMIVIMAVMLVIVLTMIVFVIMLTMIMFVIVRVEMIVLVFVLDEGRQLIAGRRLVGDLRLRHDEIDDFLLKQGAADFDERLRCFAIIFKHFALLARELVGAADEPVAQFLVGNRDAFLFAHCPKHEADPDAALGNGAVFLTGVFLRRTLIGEGLAGALQLILEGVP